MKKIAYILACVFSWFSCLAELKLGKATLLHATSKAVPIAHFTTAMSIASFSKIGGIAFYHTASPQDNLYISSLTLSYNAGARDGNRLNLTLNGQSVHTPLYDWEMVPIAKYANSDTTEAFTMFGYLEDSLEKEQVLYNGGRVLNYHSAFKNTLMGLRMFQLDLLIADTKNSTDLPANDTGYILGTGERKPDTAKNNKNALIYELYYHIVKKHSYRSYIICDSNQKITFSVRHDSLKITGEPYYFFWAYNTDTSYRLHDSLYKIIENNIQKEYINKVDTQDIREKWLIDNICYTHYQGKRNINNIRNSPYYRDTLYPLLHEASSAYSKLYCIYLLESMLIEQKLKDLRSEIYLKDLSTKIADASNLLENINPQVWSAGRKTMQYAAFFRYCKSQYPEMWKNFIKQINSVRIKEVETPVVYQPSRN